MKLVTVKQEGGGASSGDFLSPVLMNAKYLQSHNSSETVTGYSETSHSHSSLLELSGNMWEVSKHNTCWLAKWKRSNAEYIIA